MEWRQRLLQKQKEEGTGKKEKATPTEYDVSHSLQAERKRKQQEPAAAAPVAGPVKRMKYEVDASVQQDAIAKYRQMKAMKLAGKGGGSKGPKHGKQRQHSQR